MDSNRRMGRKNAKKNYAEDVQPYPEGPPTESAHRIIEQHGVSANAISLGTVDNLIVYVFFASKRSRPAEYAVIPSKFPESFDSVASVSKEFLSSLYQIPSYALSHPEEDEKWREKVVAVTLDGPLQEAVATALFEQTVMRYIPFLKSPWVRMGGVRFEGDVRRQCGIVAKQDLEADLFLWELSGVLSLDEVIGSSISTIVPHASQRMTATPRIMVGPARFVNHCCKPNALLYPLVSRPVLVIRLKTAVKADSEITVDYGPDYWQGARCRCVVCSPIPPTFALSRGDVVHPTLDPNVGAQCDLRMILYQHFTPVIPSYTLDNQGAIDDLTELLSPSWQGPQWRFVQKVFIELTDGFIPSYDIVFEATAASNGFETYRESDEFKKWKKDAAKEQCYVEVKSSRLTGDRMRIHKGTIRRIDKARTKYGHDPIDWSFAEPHQPPSPSDPSLKEPSIPGAFAVAKPRRTYPVWLHQEQDFGPNANDSVKRGSVDVDDGNHSEDDIMDLL